ncbi:metal-sensing transcriptional repressor [Phycicoccus sonneratiae]|uniref:Metal-sensing transcriptional repressor n=1 Tax=Phycicoccus sonneratiae TaxID=2807628 RepID=A0ABS2CIN4_9MICO|nr:metal-sensing transcriptional repressor [Phycicoccus sonneraticus]MBM6399328.1 metal-sensing transcriptional repressor [Phycicoccus sonneraticus]
MRLDPVAMEPVLERLRRAQEVLGEVVALVEEGRGCPDAVVRLAEAGTELDRAGYGVVTLALRQCALDPKRRPGDLEALERLFLSLA